MYVCIDKVMESRLRGYGHKPVKTIKNYLALTFKIKCEI
jgi:hypothetical protein